MIELPESRDIAGQINDTIIGKRITSVISAHTPHKLVWYYGEPPKYPDILVGRAIGKASAYGGIWKSRSEVPIFYLGRVSESGFTTKMSHARLNISF